MQFQFKTTSTTPPCRINDSVICMSKPALSNIYLTEIEFENSWSDSSIFFSFIPVCIIKFVSSFIFIYLLYSSM
jgi:hypothetical protein